MRLWLIAFATFTLVGCASTTRQTDAFFNKPHNLPQAKLIEGVPFIAQEKNHCGPATLAMAMNWSGKMVTADELANQVYTPGMSGSFQADMISASRRHGLLAIPITGLDALLMEVAAGNPVIVFENLALSWWPRWHYALVFGYDLTKQTVVMHSGPDAVKHEDMRIFERSWELGEYWGLVVLPPGKLAALNDELAHVRAAATLEQLGHLNEADQSYRKILERWPTSLTANIGAANIAFSKKNLSEALRFLLKATEAHPGSAAAWHNLAIAYGAAKQIKNARRSARQAIELAPADVKPTYQVSLKEWIR